MKESVDRPYYFLIFIIILIILFFHVWKLNSVPQGYFWDETSRGYNAYHLLQNGTDEYGRRYPLFFEGLGDFTSPIYYYAMAIVFKYLGISEFNIRFTSFLFYFSALIIAYLLINKIFRNKIINIYLLLSFGFLPWFFIVSRFGVEIITWLSLTMLFVYFLYLTFHDENNKRKNLFSLACGICLGALLYTYQPSRLLTFIFFFSLLLLYLRKKSMHQIGLVSGGFTAFLIPFLSYTLTSPGQISKRFREITYLYDSSTTIIEKIQIFLENLSSYFDFNFLILRGDPLLRHSSGYSGELLISVYLLLIVFIIALIIKKLRPNTFITFCILQIIFMAAGSSLVNDRYQANRTLVSGLFIIILSCYAFDYILKTASNKLKNVLVGLIFFITIWQSIEYINHYFTVYPYLSTKWFGSYGLEQALDTAVSYSLKKVIVYSTKSQNYIHVKFYKALSNKFNNMNIEFTNLPLNEREKVCIIYIPNIDEYEEPLTLNQYIDLSQTDWFVKLICHNDVVKNLL